MSVRAMVELASEVGQVPAQPRQTHRYVARPNATGTLNQAADLISKLLAYFPSEAVGMYLLITGIALPDTNGKRTFWYVFGLVITIGFALIHIGRTRAKLNGGKIAWLLGIAAASYLTWAAAMPSSPWIELDKNAPRGAAIIAAVLTGFLPEITQLLKLRVPWKQA